MFSCISNYISYYYNRYFTNYNSIEQNITVPIHKNTSSLEIQDLYELKYSTTINSPKNIELIFYKIYSNEIEPFYSDKKNSSIFKYNDKIFKLGFKKNYDNYIVIIDIINTLKLNNIVTPEQIYYNKYKQNEYIEIFPYYPDGDLFNYFEKNIFTINEKIQIFAQIVDIISTLHKNNIAHRDIKLENFLIQKNNGELIIKITDLDFSCIATENLDFRGGTMHYASYELINNQKFTSWYSSDIWSLTIILYILIFNVFPWNNTLTYNTYNKLTKHIDKPCDLFNYYISQNPNDYWHNNLNYLFKKNPTHLSIFTHLFTYGFNTNWQDRTDINYIKHLLTYI
jgi:serine/threonine protein kinase